MTRFLATKFLQYGIVLILTITINFMLPRLLPGGPTQYLLGDETGALTPEMRQQVIAQLGLDQSMGTQFVVYLRGLMRGDLGHSYVRGTPIRKIISERLPWSVLLGGISLILSTLAGVFFGIIAAWSRGKKRDIGLLLTAMAFASMPVFWLGMMFIVLFGLHLGWLPLFGVRTVWAAYTGWDAVVDVARHLTLPVVTLTLYNIFGSFMVMRYSMVSVLGQDFILLARAKGASKKRVMFFHAMRNALLPVVTQFMLALGFIVGGTTVTETVFSYPGIGRLMYESVLSRDYPVLQATFLIITITVVVANIIADLLYPLLDPRVRRSGNA